MSGRKRVENRLGFFRCFSPSLDENEIAVKKAHTTTSETKSEKKKKSRWDTHIVRKEEEEENIHYVI